MGKWIDEIEGIEPGQTTCSGCASYIKYENGSGWCNIFNCRVKDSHSMTKDCQQNGAIVLAPLTEEDFERSEYQVGDRIKVIEPKVHHASWQEYQVLQVFKNEALYRSSQSYLTEARWYYCVQTQHGRHLWLPENKICCAEQSNLICTEEII